MDVTRQDTGEAVPARHSRGRERLAVQTSRDVRRLTQAPVLGDVTADLSGGFSVIRVAEEEIQAATASTRALSVFYAENEDLHLVGTRALHVHLVANDGRVA